MRVFIGGAHNGKRDYVRNLLKDEERTIQWFDGVLPNFENEEVVVAGLEKWLAQCGLNEEEAIQRVMNAVTNRKVILILTDIGRGIVPIDAEQRDLRDVCGRLYQKLIGEAEEVTQIWYGIAHQLKKRGEGL